MNDDVLAPVDFMAVEFPHGRVTGDAFEFLFDLVQRRLVRVLDLEFIAKASDGTVRKIQLGDVEHSSDLDVRMWDSASSGLLDDADIDAVAASIKPGGLAGILVYENAWLAPLMEAVSRSDANLVGTGRIQVDDLLAAVGSAAVGAPQ